MGLRRVANITYPNGGRTGETESFAFEHDLSTVTGKDIQGKIMAKKKKKSSAKEIIRPASPPEIK